MIKVVSVKNATIGNFDAMYYNQEAKGLIGTTNGIGINVFSCKRMEAQSIIQGIHNQVGKREPIVDLDSIAPAHQNGTMPPK